MKKPEQTVRISKEHTVSTLAEVLDFQDSMIQEHGDIAKDNSLYRLDFDSSGYDDRYDCVVYVEFSFVGDNPNYEAELREYYNHEIEKKNKALKEIDKKVAALVKKNLGNKDRLDRLTSAIVSGKSIPNINEQIDHLKKSVLKINEDLVLLRHKKSLIVGGEEVKEELLKSHSQSIQDDLKCISNLISEVNEKLNIE